MALSDITASALEENHGELFVTVRGFDVAIRGSKFRGYEATFSLFYCDEGTDAHVSFPYVDALGDTIAELKQDIMHCVNKSIGYTAKEVKKLATKYDFTGSIEELEELIEKSK